jgi:hypothetical protein
MGVDIHPSRRDKEASSIQFLPPSLGDIADSTNDTAVYSYVSLKEWAASSVSNISFPNY